MKKVKIKTEKATIRKIVGTPKKTAKIVPVLSVRRRTAARTKIVAQKPKSPTYGIKVSAEREKEEMISVRWIKPMKDYTAMVIDLTVPAYDTANRTNGWFGSRLSFFAKPILKITSLCLIVMMNWAWLNAIGQSLAYMHDEEMSVNNNLIAGVLDFELESPSDFAPSAIGMCGSAQRSISIVNNGNPFKYTASSTNLDSELCDYVTLIANVDGGDAEYIGPLNEFNFGTIDYSDPAAWEFELKLDADVPTYLDGATCTFDLDYFGSQTRHNLPLGGGFYDFETINNSITANLPEFCTQTQGGWGATCHGDNPACLLTNNWNAVIGESLIVGIGRTITLTSPEAVRDYLPDGSTAEPLNQSYTDPISTNSGNLGGQLTALKINVLFSSAGIGLNGEPHIMPIGNSIIGQGSFAGLSVDNFLDLAEKVLGGDLSALYPYDASVTDISSTAASINENYDNCTENKGYLLWPECTESICGNGIVEAGEQCDDGNNMNEDSCNNECQKSCLAVPEICDGIDNDCDNEIDNNIFKYLSAGSSPTSVHLDGGCYTIDATDKVKSSDDIRATQNISSSDPAKYIYLDWQFDDIPDDATIGTSSLALEHREYDVAITVEWWQASTSNYIEVCDPAESAVDTVSRCDMSPYIQTVDQAANAKFRIKIIQDGNCHEDLDWAYLDINYQIPSFCSVCGDNLLADDEQCDDGNDIDDDGCSATCQTEDPSACIKINEVYYNPDSCHGGKNAEWIELYNQCNFAINLLDWHLSDNGGPVEREEITQSQILAGHSFAVIAADQRTLDYWPSIPTSALKITLGGSRLFLGLGDSGDRLLLIDPSGALVDAMSYGSDTSILNPSATNASRGHSLSRKPAGADTDTAADWFDTHYGSIPPGPNPGTNPHDADGNPLIPTGENIPCCEDYGLEAIDNSDELSVNPDLAIDTVEILSAPAANSPVIVTVEEGGPMESALTTEEYTGNDSPADGMPLPDEGPIPADNDDASIPEDVPTGTDDAEPDNGSDPAIVPDQEPAVTPEIVTTTG